MNESRQNDRDDRRDPVEFDAFGFKAKFRPSGKEDPPPRTLKELGQHSYQKVLHLIALVVAFPGELLQAASNITRGLGGGFVETQVQQSHDIADDKEGRAQEEAEAQEHVDSPPSQTGETRAVNEPAEHALVAALDIAKAKGCVVRIVEKDGVLCLLVLRPEKLDGALAVLSQEVEAIQATDAVMAGLGDVFPAIRVTSEFYRARDDMKIESTEVPSREALERHLTAPKQSIPPKEGTPDQK